MLKGKSHTKVVMHSVTSLSYWSVSPALFSFSFKFEVGLIEGTGSGFQLKLLCLSMSPVNKNMYLCLFFQSMED